MPVIVWNSVYFKPDSVVDNWGDPVKMNKELIERLDELRSFIRIPLIVTSGFREGDPGQHGQGNAVDVVAPRYEGTLLDLYMTAERFGFSGIGVYPQWTTASGYRCGGLHLDVGGRTGRWLGVKNTDVSTPAKNIYLKLSQANLKRYGVV